jgi:uncharacterized membrane protein YphA (DoxX/SURF4 family)
MTTSNVLSTTDFATNSDSQRVARRRAPTVARFALGAIFFVFGLNGFLNFIPPPSGPMPAGAMAFGAALMQTGYMFPLIKGTEVIAGTLLLANRFVPLALTLLAPVVVNIVAFHALLAPAQIGMAVAVLLIELYLAWSYRAVYAPMLARRATPGSK